VERIPDDVRNGHLPAKEGRSLDLGDFGDLGGFEGFSDL
jgi:hypothetical protein